MKIWDVTTIILRRVQDIEGSTGIQGSANWEYIPGNAHTSPRVILVAGRGIEISHNWVNGKYKENLQYFRVQLEILRVQNDGLVPPIGAPISPEFLLGASLIEPHVDEFEYNPLNPPTQTISTGSFPKLMARNAPAGLYLEFPIFGSTLPPPQNWAVRDNQDWLPMSIELTFSDISGNEGYAIDVQYYTYDWSERYNAGGCHITIWVTKGVKIRSDGAEHGGINGAIKIIDFDLFQISAEFWQVDKLGDLPMPWSEQLPVTPSLALKVEEMLSSVPRLTVNDDSKTTRHNGITLTRAEWEEEPFDYGLLLDTIDIAIGFVPVVGDVVDIAETAYAWQTGYDKWGRPVSNFQLALMTIGAAVPIVSSGFTKNVAAWVASQPATAKLLNSPGLSKLFFRAITGIGFDLKIVTEAMGTSRTFQSSKNLGDVARNELVDDLAKYVANNPSIIKAYVSNITAGMGNTWLALDDVFDFASNSFRLATMDAGFQRWLIKNNDPSKTPKELAEEYLRKGARGKARAMAEALLGNSAVGKQRNPPRVARYPSEAGRPLILGSGAKTLSQFSGEELLDAVGTAAKAAIDSPSSMRVVSAGAIIDADVAANFTEAAIRSDFEKLLKHISPDGTVAGINADALKRLVGGDKLNKQFVSLEERAFRVTKALIIARDEAAAVGLNVDNLADGDLADALLDFVHGFVVRHGTEWGPRYELRLAAELHGQLGTSVDAVRTQLRILNTLGTKLASGPDHVIYHNGVAYFVQAKAYNSFDNLIGGAVTFERTNTGPIKKVLGPDLPAQTVKDAIRIKHWDGYVPPPGVSPPDKLPPGFDPVAAGWVPVSPKRLLLIDDIYLKNLIMNALGEASQKTGKSNIDVLNDLEVSQLLKSQIERGLGRNIDLSDPDLDLYSDLDNWLEAAKQIFTDELNVMFKDPGITQHTGSGLEFVVKLASESLDDIPRLLWGGN